MARPRPGGFAYAGADADALLAEIALVRSAGADGVVCGVLAPGGAVDLPLLRRCVAAAHPLPVTFHRAFDELRDQEAGLEELVEAGVSRVLTSGGAATAVEGIPQLRRLVDAARGRIVVMAGGGVRPANVARVVGETGVAEVHARATDDPGRPGLLRRALLEV